MFWLGHTAGMNGHHGNELRPAQQSSVLFNQTYVTATHFVAAQMITFLSMDN